MSTQTISTITTNSSGGIRITNSTAGIVWIDSSASPVVTYPAYPNYNGLNDIRIRTRRDRTPAKEEELKCTTGLFHTLKLIKNDTEGA